MKVTTIVYISYRLSYNCNVKYYDWNSEKNVFLLQTREISFEDVVVAISEQKVISIIEHPNKSKYSHQKTYIIEMQDYVYVVPFVEDDEKIFLKTIYPSRKLTKVYLKGDKI
jgi:uncharacterized DUF497 family protein